MLCSGKPPSPSATAKTRDLAQHTILADIPDRGRRQAGADRAADGQAGAIVIDVGINRLPDGKIVGDVGF